MKNYRIFFRPAFFITCLLLAFLYFVSFFISQIFPQVQLLSLILIGYIFIELVFLFSKKMPIAVNRVVPERMSNGDKNEVKLYLQNKSKIPFKVNIREELPHQLNTRDFVIKNSLKSKENLLHTYDIFPKLRGLYTFGNCNVYGNVFLGLLERRWVYDFSQDTKVYPSYLSLRNYDLKTLKTTADLGIRKTRKIGHSLEFEQIKNYVMGDEIRNINWKSTAKRNQFMVNQYTDEKSKEVYCIVDTGRNMKFPFKGLSLVDYSINSALIILKNALNFQDKSGVLSFNKNVAQFVKAEQRPNHIQKILEALYNINPKYYETDFSKLYAHIKRLISHRSLLILFTNFEDMSALERQLPSFKAINKSHVLLVVFFKNVEIQEAIENREVKDKFQEVLIEKQLLEKNMIVSELQKNNIQTILTSPEDLTINLLNKYLEIKAKSLI